jgi:hypothetical protein
MWDFVVGVIIVVCSRCFWGSVVGLVYLSLKQ